MKDTEEQGYRNPAYIYDECLEGNGPDSRSSSSSSSRSVMKDFREKLRGHRHARWILLAVVIVVVVLIIGITVAIYFARNTGGVGSNTVTPHASVNGTSTSSTTNIPSDHPSITTQSPTSEETTSTQTTEKSTTPKPTTITPSTTVPLTTPTTTTIKTSTQTTSATTITSTVQTPTSTTTKTTTNATQTSTTPTSTTTTPITTTPITSTGTTKSTSAPVASTTAFKTTTTTTSMSTPSTPSKQNLTVAMNDILFNPTDVTSLTLRCDGSYRGRLESLTIRKQFKDGFEPIAVAIFNDSNFVEVVKLYPNITHLVDVTSDSVTLSLNLDPFRCIDLTNYTCSVVDEEDVARAEAPISVFLPEPLLGVPHAVVEARELTLQCLAEIWHQNGDVVWKFKPPQATRFMLFSVPPVTTVKYNNCTTVVNSTLTFNVTSFEHDAEFRCEIVPRWPDPQVIQTRFSDVTLKVVPGNYCEGKRSNTIYPHPHGPCTLVVYCLSTGPLVFEIECEPNHCYDYVKTACVLRDTG